MAIRALKRATAHQVFRELMEDEFSAARRSDMGRRERREAAWAKAKLIAKSMIKYTEEHKDNTTSGKAEATLIKASDLQKESSDAAN